MLQLADVGHVFPDGTRALGHVTRSVPCGIMSGLSGPIGAKSTLMRNVATLQTPTDGSIRSGAA